MAVAIKVEKTLSSAEQRQYFDGRQEDSGSPVSVPARVVNSWRARYVWLQEVEGDDAVQLVVRDVPAGGIWWIVMLLICGFVWLVWREPLPRWETML